MKAFWGRETQTGKNPKNVERIKSRETPFLPNINFLPIDSDF